MKRKFLAVSLALVLFSSASPVAMTQTKQAPVTSAQDWQELRGLKPGKEILIELKPGLREPFRGTFVGISGTVLTVSQDGLIVNVEQADIQRIYRSKGWPRSRTAKIGAATGMLIGMFVGIGLSLKREKVARPVSGDEDLTPAFAGFAIGTAAGAGLGALIGGHRKGKLLYKAK